MSAAPAEPSDEQVMAELAHKHCFKAYEMPPQGDQLYMFNLDRIKALVSALKDELNKAIKKGFRLGWEAAMKSKEVNG